MVPTTSRFGGQGADGLRYAYCVGRLWCTRASLSNSSSK